MRKELLLLSALLVCLLSACTTGEELPEEPQKNTYQQITAQQAKTMMEQETAAVILDVREQDEFDAGHIPGATLLSVNAITEDSAAAVIPDKDTVVLVYCRSGNRSKTASDKLVALGYTQVYEFGGINSWPYEVVK